MDTEEVDQVEWSTTVMNLLNQIRRNPTGYIGELERIKSYFKGKNLKFPEFKFQIATNEGPKAYDEAINFLKKQPSLPEIEFNIGLANIAKDLVEEVEKNKDLDLLEKVDINELIDKYGRFTGSFARVMDFGSRKPEYAVSSLIVSDGDTSRGQRSSLFNEKMKQIGAWTGKEETYGNFTVIVMCTNFKLNDGVEDPYKGRRKKAEKVRSNFAEKPVEKPPEKKKEFTIYLLQDRIAQDPDFDDYE